MRLMKKMWVQGAHQTQCEAESRLARGKQGQEDLQAAPKILRLTFLFRSFLGFLISHYCMY